MIVKLFYCIIINSNIYFTFIIRKWEITHPQTIHGYLAHGLKEIEPIPKMP